MGKAPQAIEIAVSVEHGDGAVAALDEAIADLAIKLAEVPSHHRAVAADIVEHIERLAAVRNSIQRATHG